MVQNLIFRRLFQLSPISTSSKLKNCFKNDFPVKIRRCYVTTISSAESENRSASSNPSSLFRRPRDTASELFEGVDGHKFLIGLDNTMKPHRLQDSPLSKRVINRSKKLALNLQTGEPLSKYKIRKDFVRLPWTHAKLKQEKHFADEIFEKWWSNFEPVFKDVNLNDLGKFVINPLVQINMATRGGLIKKKNGRETFTFTIRNCLPFLFSPDVNAKFFAYLLRMIDVVWLELNEIDKNELDRRLNEEFVKFFHRVAANDVEFVSNHMNADVRQTSVLKVMKLNFVNANDSQSAPLIRLYSRFIRNKSVDNLSSYYAKRITPIIDKQATPMKEEAQPKEEVAPPQ